MMYGCGGGNLDICMVTNIKKDLLAGSTDHVKFTGQIKFSKRLQGYENTIGRPDAFRTSRPIIEFEFNTDYEET